MELSDAQYDEMVLLSTGRWDPRRGKKRIAGALIESTAIGIFVMIMWTGCVAPNFSSTLFVILIFLLISPSIWYKFRSSRIQSLARRHHYFMCPWCQYVLDGLDPVGHCPECGHTYEKDLCIELYQSAYCSMLNSTEKTKKERPLWRRAILLRDGMIQAEHSD